MEYVTEALQCYIHGLNRAAAVMLGAASEQAILLLIEGCGRSISDAQQKGRFISEVDKASSIVRKYAVYKRRLSFVQFQI